MQALGLQGRQVHEPTFSLRMRAGNGRLKPMHHHQTAINPAGSEVRPQPVQHRTGALGLRAGVITIADNENI